MDPPDLVCHVCREPFWVLRSWGQTPRLVRHKSAKREVFIKPWTHFVCVHEGCIGTLVRQGQSPIDREWALSQPGVVNRSDINFQQ